MAEVFIFAGRCLDCLPGEFYDGCNPIICGCFCHDICGGCGDPSCPGDCEDDDG
jgi:hypothetical protein